MTQLMTLYIADDMYKPYMMGTRRLCQLETASVQGSLACLAPSFMTLCVQDGGGHQSDNDDMMSGSHDPGRPHPPTAPLSSCSSRRSSITDLAAMATEGEGKGGVVEWHAGTNEDTTCQQETQRDSEEEVIDVSELPSQQTPPTDTMTTTVLIDPPEDQLETQQVQLMSPQSGLSV